jgi:hypothetical protein
MVVQDEPDRSASRLVAGAWVNWRILHGDVREQLASLPDGCVQTCVTSPPYFGLRSYLPGTVKLSLSAEEREQIREELSALGVFPL